MQNSTNFRPVPLASFVLRPNTSWMALMTLRLLLVLNIALGVASPVLASGDSPWTSEMQQWMTYYYLNPQPQHAVAYLKPLNEAFQASKGRSLADEVNRGGVRSFYAKVFAQSDETVRELERELPTQPEDIRAFALEALRRCGTRECLRVSGADESVPASGESSGHLDDAWASFMATGEQQYVEEVASSLPLLQVRGDPSRLVVGGAAKWSLASNAYQHSRVLEICRRLSETADPDSAAILREIVASAEAERLSNPPSEPR
jgi:hypothetical protein